LAAQGHEEGERLQSCIRALAHPLLDELWCGLAQLAGSPMLLPRDDVQTIRTLFLASQAVALFTERPESLSHVVSAIRSLGADAAHHLVISLVENDSPPSSSVLGLVARLLHWLSVDTVSQVRSVVREGLTRAGLGSVANLSAHHDFCVALAAAPHLPDTAAFLVW
jgi:hypothetical protein